MSEKIRFQGRDPGDPVEWSLLAVVTPVIDEVIAVVKPGEPFDVELRVNGIEVSFCTIVKRLRQEFAHEVRREAVKLIKERANALDDATYKARQVIERAVSDLARDLGVETED